MSFTSVSILLPFPVIILPVYTHSLVTVSAFISLFFAVLLGVAFVVVHIIPISVAVTAAVLISSQLHCRVLF